MNRLKQLFYIITLGCIAGLLFILSTHGATPWRIMTSSDELEHFKYAYRMYEGFLHLDPVLFFSSPAFVYGFGYFLLSFLCNLPFLAMHNTFMIILIPRLISVVFSLMLLILFYRIVRIKGSPTLAFLMTGFIVSMPLFWAFGTSNHPDAMMFFFLLLSFYYLLKNTEETTLNTLNFKKASASLAVSISTKLQAVFYYPVFFLYIFFKELSQFDFSFLKKNLKIWLYSLAIIIGLCLLISPYLLHPMGRTAFIHQVFSTLHDNTRVNCSNTVMGKLNQIAPTLFPSFLWILSLPFLFIQSIQFFKKPRNPIVSILSISIILNLIYLLFWVNRLNAMYYFNTVLAILVSLVPFMSHPKREPWAKIIFGLLLVIQLGYHVSTYQKLAQEPQVTAQEWRANRFIMDSLKSQTTPQTHILISLNAGFEYEKIGLEINQIQTIRGPLTALMFQKEAFNQKWKTINTPKLQVKRFYEKDFIILKQQDKAVSKIFWDGLKNGTLSYEIWKENSDIIIFRKRP